MSVDSAKFRAELSGYIKEHSSGSVFRLGEEELRALGWESGNIFAIGRGHYQLLPIDGDPQTWYLFKVPGNKPLDDCRVEEGKFFRKNKEIPIIDLVGWRPQEVAPSVEAVKVPDNVDVEPKTSKTVPESKKEGGSGDFKSTSNVWFLENFHRYAAADRSRKTDDAPKETVIQWDSCTALPGEGSNRHFWFTLEYNFEDSRDFWEDLKHYYRVNGDELARKLAPLDPKEDSPVFSKRAHLEVDLVDLNTTLVQRIGERVQALAHDKDDIRKQLLEIEDILLKRGLNIEDNRDYQDLYAHQKEIVDCIDQAKKTLNRYSQKIQDLDKEAGKTLSKSVVDIHGSPVLISKHYEKVTEKLIDLNLEIGSLRKRQQELEQELIKRLRDVEDAKAVGERLAQLERQQILDEYHDENRDSMERRASREYYEELGSLSENTAFIQRKIEEEKKNLNYYLDNLKSLSSYDNYETAVFEHFKRKQEVKRDVQNLRREVYKIKLFLSRREKKYDEFFRGVEGEMRQLREDISKACLENGEIVDRCVDVWKRRWSEEGRPLMSEMFDRTAKIVAAFAPIPSTQIVQLSKLKEKLIGEVADRQREWERVFGEIKKEFREMKYELSVPMSSDLDQRYLTRLDEAELSLSKGTRQAIFLPEEHFRLANHKDDRVGLDPKVQDDDDFLVIDQVWETLTPEQEKELERRLSQEQDDGAEEAREYVLKNQLLSIQNRFRAQKETMEVNSREMTEGEKREKYRDIESNELHLWRGDNYLIANSRGEFKETLYEITKKLFSLRSVRVVDNNMEFTDTGLVRDGNTEILSAKDYFIKPEDRDPLDAAADDLDLSEIVNVYEEPDEKMVELLSDPTYVAHARERDEKLAKLSAPLRPSVTEWAQIHLKKYHGEKGKIYDVETLRGKLLEMEDEVKVLKKYHDTKGEQLEKALEDRDASMADLRVEIDRTKSFLEDRKQSLREILKDVDRAIDEKIKESHEEMMKAPPSPVKEKKKGFVYWMSRLWNGPKDEDDDFTAP